MFAFASDVNIWTRDVSAAVALRVCDRDDSRLPLFNLIVVRSTPGQSVDSVVSELSPTIMSKIRHGQDEQATWLQTPEQRQWPHLDVHSGFRYAATADPPC